MEIAYVIGAVAILICLWGAISPRSQWEVLQSWQFRDREANEPSDIAFLLQRIGCIIMIVLLVIVGVSLANLTNENPDAASSSTPTPGPSAAESLWDAEAVMLYDYIVPLDTTAPASETPMTTVGYQLIAGAERTPGYLWELEEPTVVAGIAPGLGESPANGASALDTADLVVGIRLNMVCTPHQVVVIETAGTVQIAVYASLIGNAENGCEPSTSDGDDDPVLVIPIDLASPLGDRELQGLDGSPVKQIG